MCVREYDVVVLFFFFQAEDGIRDVAVTGVQTCALPISRRTASKKGIYSYRSASTGSSRAAFLAGRIPNSRPVNAARQRARTTEPMGTYDGTGVALASTRDTSQPTAMPIMPPTSVKIGRAHV